MFGPERGVWWKSAVPPVLRKDQIVVREHSPRPAGGTLLQSVYHVARFLILGSGGEGGLSAEVLFQARSPEIIESEKAPTRHRADSPATCAKSYAR